MSEQQPHRFRLRLASGRPGVLTIAEPHLSFQVAGMSLVLAARNAATLKDATSFHIDAGGFESAAAAREAAERLRVRIRVLNALTNLGINAPDDGVDQQTSAEVKAQVLAKSGGVLLDGNLGVLVYPDDGRHAEGFITARLEVTPADFAFVFEGLEQLWGIDVGMDEKSLLSLQLLGASTFQPSASAAFLTCYLALQQLIATNRRRSEVVEEIDAFARKIEDLAAATSDEKLARDLKSLRGSLDRLHDESFGSALRRYAARLEDEVEYCGMRLEDFLRLCVKTRNDLAHDAAPATKIPIEHMAQALRQFTLSVLWTRNKLTSFTLQTPPSRITLPAGGMQFRVM